jgi:hypothetical protein
MDPNISATGNVLLPFVIGILCCVFAWVQADLGVTRFGFDLVYKDQHPRAYWLIGDGAPRVMALACFAWGVVNLWHVLVIPGFGSGLAQIVLCGSSLVAIAALIATDFRFDHVWITFRLGWLCPVWRDQSPGWFWFWECMQIVLFGAVVAYAAAALF